MEEETRTVSEDAYVAFRTNLYAAPWQPAGKEVCVHLIGEQVHLLRHPGGTRQTLAVHALCTGKHQRIEDKALHAGMPFAAGRSPKKTTIAIVQSGPTVEQRSLEVYAEAAGCDRAERAA